MREFRSAGKTLVYTSPIAMDYYTILRTFGEGIDFPIFALDRAYRYLYFNPVHAQLMRTLYGAEIQTGDRLPDYQAPEDWAIAQRNIDRALGGEHVLESAYSGTGENRGYFRVSHHPLRDDMNTVVGVVVVAQDLTEQARALDALQMSERRFRGLVEKSSDAIALLAADGTVLYDSPSAPGLLGYAPEDWIGESAFGLIHPDDVAPIQHMLAELATQPGAHAHHLFRLGHRDGHWLWIEGTATNLLHDPSVQAIVVNYRDVTDRVNTESLLRASEARLREVWETTSDAMVLSDEVGVVLAANPAFLELYGYAEHEIVGHSFAQIFPPEMREMVTQEYQRVFRAEATATVIESEVQRKDGTRRVVESRATFLTAGETRIAMLSTIRDITERKVAEDRLRETNRQLEVALDELRRTQAQLVRQERLAAVGQLAAGIAHDFNNILSVILLQAQLALRAPEVTASEVTTLGGIKPSPAALRERLKAVVQQAGRAGDLVQQILDFSRSAVLQTRALNVDDFFREQAELLRRAVEGKIRIGLEGLPLNVAIDGDPTRLQQLFTNLALNARDAMPQGGDFVIRLDLLRDADMASQAGGDLTREDGRPAHDDEESRMDMAVGPWLRIAVRDSGMGIPATALSHIFEPFFTTKQPGQGTGLGLAQVYGIVKQHNGHIDVRSAEGAGTTFTIYLPVHTGNGTSPPASPTTAWSDELPQGHGETILVVEEDASLAHTLFDTLRALGYVPLLASDLGRDLTAALDKVTQSGRKIDLVLSDLAPENPEMAPSAVTLQTMADGFRNLDVPVVVLVGPDSGRMRDSLAEHGIAGWLSKPPELSGMAHLLNRLLNDIPDGEAHGPADSGHSP